ncbi:MAG: hypothetical protein QM621_01430 [Aeromicrobium sp.]|uniref:DUF6777 domain-containing protein n=1 Tax=Aeromicrobium sp. TaxID=1871063 RepID=UPI0039E56045
MDSVAPVPVPPPPPARRKKGAWLVGGLVLLLVLGAAAGAGYWWWSQSDDSPSAESVVLEAVDAAGESPWTESVAGEVEFSEDALERIDEESSAGGRVDGATPGLYGGTNDNSSCDREQLANFLTEDDAKSEAWADALDVTVDEVSAFVGSLAPVLLTRDTAVVNHGYEDGKAVPYPAVLQAGSAVLVDSAGAPVVRCACGNPLGVPDEDLNLSDTSGTTWKGYEPESVVGVAPAAEPVDELTLIDAVTSEDRQTLIGGPATEVVYPFDEDGEVAEGWTVTESEGIDSLSFSYLGVSEYATTPGVFHYAWARGAQEPACWLNPDGTDTVLCLGDPQTKELRMIAVPQPPPQADLDRLADGPVLPFWIELADGSRWLQSSGYGGLGSESTGGVWPYLCAQECGATNEMQGVFLAEGDDPLERRDDGWYVYRGELGFDAASLPDPESVKVAKAWYVAGPPQQ